MAKHLANSFCINNGNFLAFSPVIVDEDLIVVGWPEGASFMGLFMAKSFHEEGGNVQNGTEFGGEKQP